MMTPAMLGRALARRRRTIISVRYYQHPQERVVAVTVSSEVDDRRLARAAAAGGRLAMRAAERFEELPRPEPHRRDQPKGGKAHGQAARRPESKRRRG